MKQNADIEHDESLRPCVGIVLFNAKGQVWTGHRAKKADILHEGEMSLWQLPQGGIEQGEKPLFAAKRELWEETGIKSVRLLAESQQWRAYALPAAFFTKKQAGLPFAGCYRGQKQKWFAFLFTGQENEIAVNPPPKADEIEFDAWEWRDLSQVAQHIVSFKREVYGQVAAEFAPIEAHLRQGKG